jgi:hypothetical protein
MGPGELHGISRVGENGAADADDRLDGREDVALTGTVGALRAESGPYCAGAEDPRGIGEEFAAFHRWAPDCRRVGPV